MKRLILLLTLIFVFSSVSIVSAGGFYLKTIGELDVEGTNYAQYWYSGSNPTITGVAEPNSAVSFEVNGASAGSATSDASGNWSHAVTLNDGDNSVTISSEGMSPYTFTLTKGELPEGVGGMSPSDMPQAGFGLPTVLLITLALVSLSVPAIVFAKNS